MPLTGPAARALPPPGEPGGSRLRCTNSVRTSPQRPPWLARSVRPAFAPRSCYEGRNPAYLPRHDGQHPTKVIFSASRRRMRMPASRWSASPNAPFSSSGAAVVTQPRSEHEGFRLASPQCTVERSEDTWWPRVSPHSVPERDSNMVLLPHRYVAEVALCPGPEPNV